MVRPFPFQSRLVRKPGSKLFRAVRVGPYFISIQGSAGNYSTPREDDLGGTEYEEFEVLIPKAIMPWARNHWGESHNPASDGAFVYSYVPASDVQDLLNWLVKQIN